ncbi:MAG TPA: polysaccharide deacetylase family protein [Fimbriimonas sp.]|nr:polysaccharide deacetylase family protein [Fimbriimonas sp.]
MKLLRILLLATLSIFLCSCHPKDSRDDETPAPGGTEVSAGSPPTSTATDQIGLASLAQRTPVIMYHDITERRDRHSVWFDCTASEFRDQMDLIRQRGYQPVSMDDLYHHLTEGKALPPKAIVLTFDDNYQGFYDIAWPILKADNYPATVFVHTGFVGKTTGRAHMSWTTLKELVKSPLITIASHTVNHPDLTQIDSGLVDHELTESKAELERQLGKRVDYFAYPDGKNSPNNQIAAQSAGYLMSFSIENGPAEESPNIQCVNRYIQTRLNRALDQCEQAIDGAVGVYEGPVKDGPVAYKEESVDGKTLALVTGGRPVTVVSNTREGVLDFIRRTDAVAGINGTFFDMAAISATDNKLVGPCKTAESTSVIPDPESFRWPKIRNRPVIMWGLTKAAIVPYSPPLMNEDEPYKQFMPDVTDVFLGGAWLVHNGVPRTLEQMRLRSSSDIEDPRRRAAFGFMTDGTAVAAASKDSVGSSEFASMLAKVGVQEAVLLDSGFSTSLVYGEKVMASGHSTQTEPSRPVPHAIVFQGTLDPDSQAVANAAIPATDPVVVAKTTHRRRRHRRRKSDDSATAPTSAPAPDSAATPDASATAGSP